MVQFLSQNWWIVLIVAMMFFMHRPGAAGGGGCCGGGHQHGHDRPNDEPTPKSPEEDRPHSHH